MEMPERIALKSKQKHVAKSQLQSSLALVTALIRSWRLPQRLRPWPSRRYGLSPEQLKEVDEQLEELMSQRASSSLMHDSQDGGGQAKRAALVSLMGEHHAPDLPAPLAPMLSRISQHHAPVQLAPCSVRVAPRC